MRSPVPVERGTVGNIFWADTCPIDMKRKRAPFNNATAKARLMRDEKEERRRMPYDLSTPLWNKYYQEVRKSIRFPRYYKRSVNW
jgi:hypothetical protein